MANIFAKDQLQNYTGSIDGTEIVQQPAAETVQPVQTQPVQTTVRTAQRTSRTMPAIDPTSPTAGMDVISRMYTDPNEEDRMRRASVANQRILAVGDALRHIGNIYNTVRYAPAQKFNSPVLEEYSRYQKGKALRDAANLRFLTYQQQRAAQDRAAAKMDMEFKLKQADDARKERLNDARISRYNAQNAKDGANQAYWETRARLLEEGYPLEKAIKEAEKAKIEEQTRLTRIKANQGGFAPRRSGGGGSGAKYTLVDEDNKTHYYPNKTMYDQGVARHNKTVPTYESVNTGKKDEFGKDIVKQQRRPTTTVGADMAKKGAEKAKRSGRTGKGSSKSKFSIHKN